MTSRGRLVLGKGSYRWVQGDWPVSLEQEWVWVASQRKEIKGVVMMVTNDDDDDDDDANLVYTTYSNAPLYPFYLQASTRLNWYITTLTDGVNDFVRRVASVLFRVAKVNSVRLPQLVTSGKRRRSPVTHFRHLSICDPSIMDDRLHLVHTKNTDHRPQQMERLRLRIK